MDKDDFPTYEESEEQVRRDMQCLHDEARDALNALIDALSAAAAASELGASPPAGFSGGTVQALINELASTLGALCGDLEVEGSPLVELVAASMESSFLGNYYTAEQTEEKLAELGVAELSRRVEGVENAISQDGGAEAETFAEYPFTMPAAELAGASSMMSTLRENRIFLGDSFFSIVGGTEHMYLKKLNVFSREESSIQLSGSAPALSASAQNFTPLWLDDAGEYMVIKVDSIWYLMSVKTGVCSQLASGSSYTYCGAARLGDIVTAVFHYNGSVYFYRRNVSGDSGNAPAIASLDSYYESGSAYDRVLNTYGDSFFVMLKYYSGDSRLKAYDPTGTDMSCSVEFATGYAEAWADGVRRRGTDCYFLLSSGGVGYQARSSVSVTDGAIALSLTAGGDDLSGSRVLALSDGVVYAVSGTSLYRLDADTMTLLETKTLPSGASDLVCSFNGSELGELWGGKYIPAGSYLVQPGDMKWLAIRCYGVAPGGYAMNPVSGRYLVVYYDSKWFLVDCLLRPVWGVAPEVSAGNGGAEDLAEADTSGFGAMSKA